MTAAITRPNQDSTMRGRAPEAADTQPGHTPVARAREMQTPLERSPLQWDQETYRLQEAHRLLRTTIPQPEKVKRGGVTLTEEEQTRYEALIRQLNETEINRASLSGPEQKREAAQFDLGTEEGIDLDIWAQDPNAPHEGTYDKRQTATAFDRAAPQNRLEGLGQLSAEPVSTRTMKIATILGSVRHAQVPTSQKRDDMGLLAKALELIAGNPQGRPFNRLTERQLIEQESEIGGQLFGPIPDGHSRDFFCLDERTWVWHEAWRNADNKRQMLTTRYETQPKGILKVQDGKSYKFIDGEELANFAVAVQLYYEQVMREIYKRDPVTGQPLTDVPPVTIEGR